jgi:hypothetical protein
MLSDYQLRQLTSETSKRIARKAERSGPAKPWPNRNRAQGPEGAMSQRSKPSDKPDLVRSRLRLCFALGQLVALSDGALGSAPRHRMSLRLFLQPPLNQHARGSDRLLRRRCRRYTVARSTPNVWATSATASPAAILSIASRRRCTESFFGRPNRTPRALARSRPSPVRARISVRSNSARPPRMVSMSRRAASLVHLRNISHLARATPDLDAL